MNWNKNKQTKPNQTNSNTQFENLSDWMSEWVGEWVGEWINESMIQQNMNC